MPSFITFLIGKNCSREVETFAGIWHFFKQFFKIRSIETGYPCCITSKSLIIILQWLDDFSRADWSRGISSIIEQTMEMTWWRHNFFFFFLVSALSFNLDIKHRFSQKLQEKREKGNRTCARTRKTVLRRHRTSRDRFLKLDRQN